MTPRKKFWRGPGSLGLCDNNGLRTRPAARGSDGGPGVYNGLQKRATIPATGPERRDDLPPCGTRCRGWRICGKRVAHHYPDGWHCISCGADRTPEVPKELS
jgi:hypothetical protein